MLKRFDIHRCAVSVLAGLQLMPSKVVELRDLFSTSVVSLLVW